MGIRGSVNLAALALLLGLCATLATPKHIIIGEGKPPILLKNPHSLLSKGVYLNPLSTEMPSNWQQRVTYTTEKNLLIGGKGDCFLANDTVDGWVIDKIISAAPNITFKGVIFDHRCNMNTTQLIEAMKKLKQAQINVSYMTSDVYQKLDIEQALYDKIIDDENFYNNLNTIAQKALNNPIITRVFYNNTNRKQRLYDKIIATKNFYNNLSTIAQQVLNNIAINTRVFYDNTNTKQTLIDKIIADENFYNNLNKVAQQALNNTAINTINAIDTENFYNNLNTIARQAQNNAMIITENFYKNKHYNKIEQRIKDKIIAANNFYNNFSTIAKQELDHKIKAIIQSGYCDQLIHDYSDTTIWTEYNIKDALTYALEHSTAYGMPSKKIILALEIPVQEYGKFHQLFEKMDQFYLGGLLYWNPKNITSAKMEEFLVFSTQNMLYNERYYWTGIFHNKTIDLHLDGLFVIKNDEY